MDICKSLPNDALIDIKLDDNKLVVKAGRSRFTLSTLPANDFPTVEEGPGSLTCSLQQSKLRRLIERTSFAMAQQDVRYYLNGMLLEVSAGIIRAVATDGHRLAMCSMKADIGQPDRHQVIVPAHGHPVAPSPRQQSDSGYADPVPGASRYRQCRAARQTAFNCRMDRKQASPWRTFIPSRARHGV